MDIKQTIRRLNEIAAFESTLKHIEIIEWMFKHYAIVVNAIEDLVYHLQYEINDQLFRFRIQNLITHHLHNCKAAYTLHEFSVICNDTNNTTSVINNNDIKIDIAIRPLAYIDEWIYIPISFK